MSSQQSPAPQGKRGRMDQRDFTGGGIQMLPSRVRGSTGRPEVDALLHQAVEAMGCEPALHDLVVEMMVTALRTGKDNTGVGDLKLINRALKEMRRANRVFHPYRETRKVVCYGSARTTPDRPDYAAAREFAERMVERGFMVITGAGDGIMGAAQAGAGRKESFGLNIRLPFEQSANPVIDGDPKLVDFNYFFTRKLTFVKEGHAFALFPGGFGTMDEGFELLTLIQTGKAVVQPIVLVDAPGGTYWRTFEQFLREHFLRLGLISPEDFALYRVTDSVEEAVDEVCRFYRVFHSYRHVGDRLVIRLNRKLGDGVAGRVGEAFADILGGRAPEERGALPEEADDEEIAGLPRLVLRPEPGNFGRLRQLIDFLNAEG